VSETTLQRPQSAAWRTRLSHPAQRAAMGEVQGQGYIAQALGVADVLAVAYFHAMTYRAGRPGMGRPRPVPLSIGHYAIALYAALIEASVIPEDELESYGVRRLAAADVRHGDLHAGHGNHRWLTRPGPAIAVGYALGLKRKASKSFVYCLFSDGELRRGRGRGKRRCQRGTGSSTT
jgi:transketolase